MPKRARVACLVAVAWLATTPGVALAHDSLAPAGASHNWLPDEEWVHRHWIPFDELTLTSELGLGPHQLRAYLYNDHRTLADLAQRRGVDLDALAMRLVAPWSDISARRRATLRERTLRILTQGHLAQHMFFHVFHGLHLHSVSHDLFGMPMSEYRTLRREGRAYTTIAARGGVSLTDLRAGIVRLIDRDQRDGIARRQAWPRQSKRIRDRTTAQLACWLRRPPAHVDPANPFGKNRFLHGEHVARWPRTAAERLSNDRRVERFRQRLQKRCWPLPRSWSERSGR